jgi:hypothetical protein
LASGADPTREASRVTCGSTRYIKAIYRESRVCITSTRSMK